jgi:hypothetical protein
MPAIGKKKGRRWMDGMSDVVIDNVSFIENESRQHPFFSSSLLPLSPLQQQYNRIKFKYMWVHSSRFFITLFFIIIAILYILCSLAYFVLEKKI